MNYLEGRYFEKDPETGIVYERFPNWLPSSGFFWKGTVEDCRNSTEGPSTGRIYLVFESTKELSTRAPLAYIGSTRLSPATRIRRHLKDAASKQPGHRFARDLKAHLPDAYRWTVKAISLKQAEYRLAKAGLTLEGYERALQNLLKPRVFGSESDPAEFPAFQRELPRGLSATSRRRKRAID